MDSFDDAMDDLPPSLRHKVLDALYPEPVRERKPAPKWPLWKSVLWGVLMIVALVISAFALIPGIFLTVVIPPLGLLILAGIGGMNSALIIWRFNLNPNNE